MLLDAAILAIIAAARRHQLHRHDQQVAAAQQTLQHLHTVYEHTAAQPLTALAQRKPPQPTADRYAQLVPTHADQVLQAPEWPALAAALSDAEKTGHQPDQLLQQAADQRALDDARSPARVLTWRIERLGHRTPPSRTALAARARSTQAVPASEEYRGASAVARSHEPTPAHAPRRRR